MTQLIEAVIRRTVDSGSTPEENRPARTFIFRFSRTAGVDDMDNLFYSSFPPGRVFLSDAPNVFTVQRFDAEERAFDLNANFDRLAANWFSFSQKIQFIPKESGTGPSQEIETHDRNIFRFRLLRALRDEPVEDGVFHEAEAILEKCFLRFPNNAPTWVRALYKQLDVSPGLAAGLLQCLGRVDYDVVGSVGRFVAMAGLQHSDAEVRDAAICAVEQWRRVELRDLLLGHRDSISWITEYAESVAEDLLRSET